jgi:hypothetical protein
MDQLEDTPRFFYLLDATLAHLFGWRQQLFLYVFLVKHWQAD